MARTAAARSPAPVIVEEPAGLTFGVMKAAAEVYWPGLGGKVADQFREWNRDLLDGKLRPAPMVLSRLSSVCGHWFCTLDPAADQRMGFEQQLVTQVRSYSPPRAIASVRKVDLLRQMMRQLYAQDGKPMPLHNSQGVVRLDHGPASQAHGATHLGVTRVQREGTAERPRWWPLFARRGA
jgi:hypothetical protein